MRSERAVPALLALSLCITAVPASHAQTNDGALKAAYIYNIAQFTVWPANAGARPLNVCVGSGHPLWQSLRGLHGKPVGERRLAVVEPGAAAPCDVAVLRTGAARPVAESNGTLAIVDEPANGYAGAVALVEEAQQLRFDIDTKEAARAGLRFSSRLLRLARNVQ
jgi:hypothetical protein